MRWIDNDPQSHPALFLYKYAWYLSTCRRGQISMTAPRTRTLRSTARGRPVTPRGEVTAHAGVTMKSLAGPHLLSWTGKIPSVKQYQFEIPVRDRGNFITYQLSNFKQILLATTYREALEIFNRQQTARFLFHVIPSLYYTSCLYYSEFKSLLSADNSWFVSLSVMVATAW